MTMIWREHQISVYELQRLGYCLSYIAQAYSST